MFQHLKNNRGDANVSKMTLVAIIFVVGAILLVMTTSAFRGPINRWFEKVTTGWFADSNGMFEADNAFLGVERNANGTYKNVQYIQYYEDGSWAELISASSLANGRYGEFDVFVQFYNADGTADELMLYGGGTCTISDDGTCITLEEWGTQTFIAQHPQ